MPISGFVSCTRRREKEATKRKKENKGGGNRRRNRRRRRRKLKSNQIKRSEFGFCVSSGRVNWKSVADGVSTLTSSTFRKLDSGGITPAIFPTKFMLKIGAKPPSGAAKFKRSKLKRYLNGLSSPSVEITLKNRIRSNRIHRKWPSFKESCANKRQINKER